MLVVQRVFRAKRTDLHEKYDYPFVEARDGRGEGLAGIDLEVTDPQSITAAATACGCAWDGDAVMVGGVRFSLQTSR